MIALIECHFGFLPCEFSKGQSFCKESYFFDERASSRVYGYSMVSGAGLDSSLSFEPEINSQSLSKIIAREPLHKTFVDVMIGSSTTLSAIMRATISGVKPR